MIKTRPTASVRRLLAVSLTAATLLAAPTPAAAALPLTLIQGGFSTPVFVTHAGDARLFVVEKGGAIKIIGGGVFLDISTLVATSGERGLLSLAFHPSYASNGLFYVMYTRISDGDVMISEFKRSANPDVADPNSERILLRVEHSSASNHNGGTLMFKNSLLYITLGDGGGAPGTRSQSLQLHVGKILRINPLDPDGAGSLTYSIPSDNPYVGKSGLDEIWSRGLRNPWRCSFDRLNGRLYCGDVGQSNREEVNRNKTAKALNHGWPLLEGFLYYNYPNRPQGQPCTSGCKNKPMLDYPHVVDGDDNSAVTGGYVSRRPGAVLNGKYVFGDFGSGRVWAVPWNIAPGSPVPAPLADTSFLVVSFGEDAAGRLYLVDMSGAVYLLNDS